MVSRQNQHHRESGPTTRAGLSRVVLVVSILNVIRAAVKLIRDIVANLR